MINALLIIIFYLASVSSSSFDCNNSVCLFIKIIAAVLLIIRLIIKTTIGKKQLEKIKNKLPKKLADVFVCLVSCVVIVILFFMAFNADTPIAKAGLLNFDEQITEIENLANKGNTSKALEKIEELKEIYGTNDRTLQEEALVQIAAGNYKESESLLDNIVDKKTTEYYLLYEETMKGNNADTIEDTEYITDFYIDGAKNHPEWAYAQRQAGISQIYNENYKSGEYYLKKSYELDPSDPLTSYNIGAAIVEQGNNAERYNEALDYFDYSIECGADENTQSHIAWYLDKIKGEEE